MLKSSKRYVLYSIFLLFSQCQSFQKEELSESVGKPGSLVIVSDKATHSLLSIDFDSLFLEKNSDSNSSQAFFELLKPDFKDFNSLFYNQRTILMLVHPDNYKNCMDALQPFSEKEINQLMNDSKSGINIKEDVFAKHQHIVYLFSNNTSNLKRKLLDNKTAIINTLIQFDLLDYNARIMADTGSNSKFTNEFKTKYGLSVQIPEGFKLNNASNNFYWFQMETNEGSEPKNIGLIVHAYPFKDSSDFNYENIRSVRDTFCKHHMPGELKGTYMGTTESKFYPTRTMEMISINGHKACKIKGWWTIRGISMSGPFVRYVIYVPEKNILVAFEGFVYRPELNLKEREIKTIEAIALSIK